MNCREALPVVGKIPLANWRCDSYYDTITMSNFEIRLPNHCYNPCRSFASNGNSFFCGVSGSDSVCNLDADGSACVTTVG